VKKCEHCGKEYIENPSIHEALPEYIKEKIKLIPSCDCLEKLREKELEVLEKKRLQECIMNRVKKYTDISVIDSKFLKSKFENADMSEKHMVLVKRYADNFLIKDKPVGMLLYGDVGIGKTFATACIANYLMEKGKTVLVMNLALYLGKLRREWDEAEQDILKQAETCDLLVIDDFGAEKGLDGNQTGWRAEKIYNLIDARYRAEKPLIISTNLNFDKDEKKCEITEKFSSQGKNRIRDRIIDMCFPVKVEGSSKRGKVMGENFKNFMS